MTLTRWLRDYVYIPLGGSRIVRTGEPPARAALRRKLALGLIPLGVAGAIWRWYVAVVDEDVTHGARNMWLFLGASAILLVALFLADHGRKYLNVWITMVMCGIWHGAAWSYVLFGVIQGLAVAVSHFYYDSRGLKAPDAGEGPAPLSRMPALLLTFVFTTLTFVLIRAPLDKALLMYKQLLVGSTFTPNISLTMIVFIVGGLVVQWLPRSVYERARDGFTRAPAPVQAGLLFALAVVLREFASAEAVPFVYGQF